MKLDDAPWKYDDQPTNRPRGSASMPDNRMTMNVTRETTFNLNGDLTLKAMREIVEQTKNLPGNARVKVTSYDDQRDRTTTTTVKVHGA